MTSLPPGRPVSILARTVAAAALVAAATALGGCAKPPPAVVKAAPPDVLVELPFGRGVTDYEDFTGRTEAYKVVDIRPQVTGKLKTIHFADGAYVSAGTPLFDIDDEFFRAQRDGSEANLKLAQARVGLATTLLTSAEKAKSNSAIAADDFAKSEAELAAAEAAKQVARFDLKKSQTTLDYTTIAAKYTGRLGKRMVDEGNIVKENETILTRLNVLDPIYVSFDIDERTLLRIRRLIGEGKIASARDAQLTVQVRLADEEGFSFPAPLTFADNQLDANTGTLRLRAELRNPSLQYGPLPALIGVAAALGAEQKGLKLLSPGMFVRVRLPVGKEHPGLLVSEEAIGSDQGQKFLYVLNDKDEAIYRRVKLGPQEGKFRVIEEGVKAGERVVVSGLQRVRQGAKVNAKMAGPGATAKGSEKRTP